VGYSIVLATYRYAEIFQLAMLIDLLDYLPVAQVAIAVADGKPLVKISPQADRSIAIR
jgi:hypothetical protein